MVTGVDLVKEQIRDRRRRAAALHAEGHRACAATPSSAASTPRIRSRFAPSPGTITGYAAPGGHGVRVDSAAYEGYQVLPHYDSLLAKLMVYAEDRTAAIRRMQRALSEYVVEGIRTNIAFHRAALGEPDFIEGQYDTRFVERLLASETGSRRLRQAVEETP